MRKYNTYRRSAPTYRGKSRLRTKRTFSFFKSLFVLVLISVLGVGAYVGLHAGYTSFLQSDLSHWHAKKIAVEGLEGRLQQEIATLAQPYKDQQFSVKDAYNFRSELVKKYPMLSAISVKRELLSGTLKIHARLREPVAQFRLSDGTVKYVDKDSTIYDDPYVVLDKEIPSVELIGKIPEKLRSDFVDLVQSTLQLDKQLKFDTLRMNLADNTVMMILPDKTVLEFAQANQLKQKAKRASQILSFARAHYAGPYQLDFRFFDEGKVFLTRKPN